MTITSRQIFDSATFYFKGGDEEAKRVTLSCLGADGEVIEQEIRQPQIEELLLDLKGLLNNEFKKAIKIKFRTINVNLKFSGIKVGKGIKVRSSMSRWFFYSSATFGSYTSEDAIVRLMTNLQKCLLKNAI